MTDKPVHVTDKCVRVDSGPVVVLDRPLEWARRGFAILTEKQWKTLVEWVSENRKQVEASTLGDVLAVATIPGAMFDRWGVKREEIKKMEGRGRSFLEIEKEKVKLSRMKCHPFATVGWSGCALAPSLLDENSISEACRMAGIELAGS